MAGDHQVLISLYHVGGDAAVSGGDALLVLAVGCLVQLQPKPSTSLADHASYPRRILAYPGSEHDAIEPAQRRGERADVASDAVAEHFDCKTSARFVAG